MYLLLLHSPASDTPGERLQSLINLVLLLHGSHSPSAIPKRHWRPFASRDDLSVLIRSILKFPSNFSIVDNPQIVTTQHHLNIQAMEGTNRAVSAVRVLRFILRF